MMEWNAIAIAIQRKSNPKLIAKSSSSSNTPPNFQVQRDALQYNVMQLQGNGNANVNANYNSESNGRA